MAVRRRIAPAVAHDEPSSLATTRRSRRANVTRRRNDKRRKNERTNERSFQSRAIRQNADGDAKRSEIAPVNGGRREKRVDLSRADIACPSVSLSFFSACIHGLRSSERRIFYAICSALARRRSSGSPATTTTRIDVAREQINKFCLFRLRVNAQGLGLKRSVTTLRGGTLGYAEIVALKVNRNPLLLGRRDTLLGVAIRTDVLLHFPLTIPLDRTRCLLSFPVIDTIRHRHHHHHHQRRLVASSFFFSSCRLSPCYHLSVCQFCTPRVCAGIRAPRRRVHPDARQAGSRRPSRSLASRCLVRCFRCSVLSLVYIYETKRDANVPSNQISFLLRMIGDSSIWYRLEVRLLENVLEDAP